MPDGSPAAGSVLPPAPCAVGVGEVPGAVPISGLTYCVSDCATGGVVEPPDGGGVVDPPGEVGDPPCGDDGDDGAVLFVLPPHPARINVVSVPTAPSRILFNIPDCLLKNKISGVRYVARFHEFILFI